MKLIKLSGIALSVALATSLSTANANTENTNTEQGFNALTYDQSSYDVLSNLSSGETLEIDNANSDDNAENSKDNIKLLDVTYEFLNEHIESGNTTLSFTVDGNSFEFTTRIETHYGLLHLYGENEQGNFMRFIRGTETSWFGDVSNGDDSYSLIDTVEIGGPGWFISSIRIPNKGDILVNGQLPVPATPENSTVIDMGYTYTHYVAGRYKPMGTRASILYFHYMLQDVLDNSGSGFYLNPVYIERQDDRFLTEEELDDAPKTYLASGWEYMFGDMDGAEAMRDYLRDFGADFHAGFYAGGSCGSRRNEYKLDDIGQPAYVYDDEEERADILYGSILNGTRHTCRNLNLIPQFLYHGFARPNRAYYENNPFLPENKKTDFGGVSDYAYASRCGTVPTIFNQNLTVDNLPLPVISSPNVTYKGQACGDEKNNNVISLQNNLPSVVDNGERPAATATVSFKSGIIIADENEMKATVTLIREGELLESASVELSVLQGNNNLSAIAGEDFTEGFKRVEFAPGESEASVDVRILDNDIYRENGTVELALGLPKRLDIAPNTRSQILIIDNDTGKPGSFNFEASAVTVSEESGIATIKVIRSGDFEGSQMIRYALIDGSARKGSDYNGDDGFIVFSDGETEKFIEVELVSDKRQNATERSFTVQIVSDVDGDIKSTQVIIGDDEAATGFVAVTTETINVDYHASQASITLERNDGDIGEITVLYETVDGTAIAGTHYANTKGSVKFDAGETTKTISINKHKVEDETEQTSFTVVLAAPQLNGAKIVTVNLLPEEERESSSGGGSLGFASFMLFVLTALRRKRI
ncbi:Calx-beta domain-containing protein [Thalassotalea crassostreae]|uniref:Calx-beta domain-containing protein n=1 Tax=Thalassotalea crassostreae TaxID=1763536 RepID=UPI000838051E|nr:Calx-beta domain-containing protein [Thalassotalea crassostreae]